MPERMPRGTGMVGRLRNLVAGAVLVLGCSDSLGDVRLTRLEIRLRDSVTTLMVNDTVRAFYWGYTLDGTRLLVVAPLAWRVVDSSIAQVDSQGLVTGRRLGSTLLVGTAEGVADSLLLSVAGTLHARAVSASETWTLADAPHGVRGELQVGGPAGPILTIESGAEVLFDSASGLTFGASGAGSLIATSATFASLRTTSARGGWLGLSFRGTERSELRHVTMRNCGGSRNDGLFTACVLLGQQYIVTGPSLLVDDVLIDSAAGYGVILHGESRFATGSRGLSVFHASGPVALLPAGAAADFPAGGSFSDNSANTIQLTEDTIGVTASWPDPGIPWSVLGPVLIEGSTGPVLTIPQGTQLRFGYGSGFIVGRDHPGGLHVGSAGGPVVSMVAVDEDIGWSGVVFMPLAVGSAIQNAVLDKCGRYSLTIYGSGCVFMVGDFAGTAPSPVLEHVTITRANYVGVAMVGGGGFGNGSDDIVITGSTGSPGSPITSYRGRVESVPPGLYTGNALDAIWLYVGMVETTQTWANRGIPYFLKQGLGVEGGANPQLTLEAGVELIFAPGGFLQIGVTAPGALRALGTTAAPVVLNGQDDFPGAWSGVDIGPLADPSTLLDHVVVNNAGADDGIASAGIRLSQDLGGIVRNSTISHSAGCGVTRFGPGSWLTDFTAPALGNTFQDNAGPDQCGP